MKHLKYSLVNSQSQCKRFEIATCKPLNWPVPICHLAKAKSSSCDVNWLSACLARNSLLNCCVRKAVAKKFTTPNNPKDYLLSPRLAKYSQMICPVCKPGKSFCRVANCPVNYYSQCLVSFSLMNCCVRMAAKQFTMLNSPTGNLLSPHLAENSPGYCPVRMLGKKVLDP